MQIVYGILYAVLWFLLSLKSVLLQIGYIICSETKGLFTKAPTAIEVSRSAKGLKKWKHLGLILDHTHFGSNGMLVGSSIAKLVALAVAADSSHTSVFLPRPLTEMEQERLKGMIEISSKQLSITSKPSLSSIHFYESVYTTLKNEKIQAQWISKLPQLVGARKSEILKDSTTAPTSWGVSGHLLHKLTNFEASFNDILELPFYETRKSHKTGDSKTTNTKSSPVAHKLMFVSPLDGKPAVAKAAHILHKAVEQKSIDEADIEQSLVHALLNSPQGELWPSPDLIINFTDVPSPSGYPSWQLRYAEIVNAGSLATETSTIWNQFHGALKSFSKTVQRFGK